MNSRFIEETLIDFRKDKIGLKEATFIITERFEKEIEKEIEERLRLLLKILGKHDKL